ncbi:Uncharacterised protein [Citrobacter portucalensis]|nr:Uncharacterised protein [Citrobacter portucalensis]
MYVCLCNAISDKKYVRLFASFILSPFSNYVNLFLLEINAVNAFVLPARSCRMN